MQLNSLNSSLPQLNNESQKRDKALEKIASAQQLKLEDSASRTIADLMQSEISTLSQGVMNANDGISMMQIADGTLSNLSDQAQKLNDLSVRNNNAAMNETQKQALQSEFSRTVQAMEQSISTTSYNGKSLFGNDHTIGLGNSSITVSLENLSPSQLSISNQDGIQAYRDQLSSASSQIGSTSNALISSTNSMINAITNVSAAKSQIADTDMAKAIQEFQQSNNRMDMSQIAIAHHTDVLRQSIERLLA